MKISYEDAAFPCPLCGRRASAGHTADGEPTLLHESPACDGFIGVDYLGYLKQAVDAIKKGMD